MDDLTETCRDLSRTDASRGLVLGNDVYDPLIFQPKLIKFTRRQYLFLNHYKLGMSLGEAALKADMTADQADRFLGKPATVEWLRDRALKDHIRNEWAEPGKWWEMGDKVLNGEKHLSKDQQVVFMAFGDRVCPKARESGGSQTKIEINIDPKAVQDAFSRQNAIEAEISR